MFARNHVYLGLGGNIGDAEGTITSVLDTIQQVRGVYNLHVSRFFQTKPISDIPQDLFVNAVCTFETTVPVDILFQRLEHIERMHGKVPKAKNEPRPIDIDLLFYGASQFDNGYLQVPHARWHERLFVLIPLLDLTESIVLQDPNDSRISWVHSVKKIIKTFTYDERLDVKPLPISARLKAARNENPREYA